jgi:hypothetical protein
METGKLPKARERESIARDTELVTPIFGGGGKPKAGAPGDTGEISG